MFIFIATCWGVFSAMLGFSVTDSWQAWSIILAGNGSYFLGRISR